MDEEFDSIQLLSLSDVIESYYQMLRNAMDAAASKTNNKSEFDGNISEEDSKILLEFGEKNNVPTMSQSLAELMICLERYNENIAPSVRETSLYNMLLRLEKAVHSTSSWELFGDGYDGPLLDLSSFEVNMVEQQMSLYITDVLVKNFSKNLFFPLSDFYSSDVIVKWRILEKMASIKLFAQETIYKQKLKLHLQERLRKEVSQWLQKEMEKLKLSGPNTILKDVENLSKILKELKNQIIMAIDVTTSDTLFKSSGCNYIETVSEAVDDMLYPVCVNVMEMMDTYQSRHRDFHVNMRDSCALSHAFYLQVKTLAGLLTTHGGKKELKLQDYRNIFSKFFINLLQVMKLECHNRIKRAVQVEMKDSVHVDDQILSSSVIVLNCICTVIDEWKRMEIEDEEQKIAFLVKITDIVCDGAKIFAESLEQRLETINTPLKEMESLKKVCVLANSVQHVLDYLQDLSNQMQWSKVLDNLDEQSDEHSDVEGQVSKILNLIHQSMRKHMEETVTKILEKVTDGAYNVSEKFFMLWLQSQSTYQSFERLLIHLFEVMESLDRILKQHLFSQFLSLMWSYLLKRTQTNFQEGQPPEYAKAVKENTFVLREYFSQANLVEEEVHKCLLLQLVELLDLHSKTTEDLQLDYYIQIAESLTSPVEYLGHIAFQAGYKTTGGDTVDLYINVQKGQRLPARKFEMSHLIVKLELCPSSLFPSQAPFKSSPVTEDLDNPVFNEFFQFSRLPSNLLDVKGAVVQVLVLNQDYSYSAEAILLLNHVQNMSGISSLEFLPVYLMPLRKFDMSHTTYQVLEHRSRWDKGAKNFINKRGKLSKSKSKLSLCIPGKSMICTFSRND